MIEDPSNRFEKDLKTECIEDPTQDSEKRPNVGEFLRIMRNIKIHQISLPEFLNVSPDKDATLNRPLPESKTDRIYFYDAGYRCNHWDELEIYNSESLSLKIDVQNPPNPDGIPKLQLLLSTSLKEKVIVNHTKAASKTSATYLWRTTLKATTLERSTLALRKPLELHYANQSQENNTSS